MRLPFTVEEFFGVFARYNDQFWFVAAALWLIGAVVLVRVWREPRRSATLSYYLGALWLWNAAAYHALLFAAINPAAWVFAAIFAAQALLFLHAGRRRRIAYVLPSARLRGIAVALAMYSFAYPLVALAEGHVYPATPTFGVPCPTAILTAAVLLTARDRLSVRIAAIPLLWTFIGGSASILFGVTADYMLLASGVVLIGALVHQQRSKLSPAFRHRSVLMLILVALGIAACDSSPAAPTTLQDLTGRWRGVAHIPMTALPTPLEMTLTDSDGQLTGHGGGVDCRYFWTCGSFYSYAVGGTHDTTTVRLKGETPEGRTWTLTGTVDAAGSNIFGTIAGPDFPASPCQMARQP